MEQRLARTVTELLQAGELSLEQVLNEGGWANGDVYLVRRGTERLVLKTYRARSFPIRLIGRVLLGRERRAYAALSGIRGIPTLVPLADPCSLLIEFVPAERISDQLLHRHGKEVVASLRAVLDEAHARGVFHMDLRNQGNVLVDDAHGVWLVDFASAVIVRHRHPLARLKASLCRRFDEYGFSKWAGRAENGS